MPRPPAPAASDAVKPAVGKGWEAWVQNDWHGVEVLRVMQDTCKIRWDWDGSEDEIWNSYVRPAQGSANGSATAAKQADARTPPPAAAGAAATPSNYAAASPKPVPAPAAKAPPAAAFAAAPKAKAPPAAAFVAAPKAKAPPVVAPAAEKQPLFALGARVEGHYGDEWFDAAVVGFERDGRVRIKWEYDGSESSMEVSEVRAAKIPSPPPPQAPSPSSSAVFQTPEPRTRDYTNPSPLDASKQAGHARVLEEVAKGAVKPEDVMRILELIPEDAPAEVRSYLQSLIPATTVY